MTRTKANRLLGALAALVVALCVAWLMHTAVTNVTPERPGSPELALH